MKRTGEALAWAVTILFLLFVFLLLAVIIKGLWYVLQLI